MGAGEPRRSDITGLLAEWRAGAGDAFGRLMPVIYDELKRLARRQLRARRSANDTLNTTALVHEAYLKLVDRDRASVVDRHHFLAVAAIAMRHIIVDYARRRSAQKRDGGPVLSVADADGAIDSRQDDVLAMDFAITKLESLDARLARLVECRVFGGMSVDECAAALGVSARTVKRDWQKARVFLARELTASDGA